MDDAEKLAAIRRIIDQWSDFDKTETDAMDEITDLVNHA